MADINDLAYLRDRNPGWRLLRAGNAPLVLSFLAAVFIEQNVRSIAASDLIARLDDVLYDLNASAPEPVYPRPAKEYLEEWAEAGWLRKYYPVGLDEPHFDATTHLERAVGWVQSLAERSFVGTESRLNTIVELLRQMAFGADTDPQSRLAELKRRRDELDAQIARVESGVVDVLDDTAIRDRYQQFADTARQLLADFREVEANFRLLDRGMRERIATWNGSKGELLDEVLGNRNGIEASDQGRSFQAFHDFLLSSTRQDELHELLTRVHGLEAVSATADRRLRRIHHDWLEAGEQTQSTVRQLSEQLRRFLDDQAWLENRRVMDILHSIESHALQLRELEPPPDPIVEVDALVPQLVLPFERTLYEVRGADGVDSAGVTAATDDEVDASQLYEQQYVDTARLVNQLQTALAGRAQVGLHDVVRAHPLEQGLAELVSYLGVDLDGVDQLVDHTAADTVGWADERGEREATLPRVTYVRAVVKAGEARTSGGETS